jgi:hypothetical protein
VAPPALDRRRLLALLADAGEPLDGEWLVVGGAAAAAWFADSRTTDDVDLVAREATRGDRIAVMDLAVALGLPVEAVNSSADYFLRRVDRWHGELVPLVQAGAGWCRLVQAGAGWCRLVQGSRAVIYRPSPTVFLLLKLARLSAVDLDDCLALLAHCQRAGEAIDVGRVVLALAALPGADDGGARGARRKALAAALVAGVAAGPRG